MLQNVFMVRRLQYQGNFQPEFSYTKLLNVYILPAPVFPITSKDKHDMIHIMSSH
jgi:hypothetical protein